MFWTGDDRAGLRGAENLADETLKQGIPNATAWERWADGHVVHAPVGSFADTHPFGLFDVAGNVQEWCRDIYDQRSYTRAAIDGDGSRPPVAVPAGQEIQRVIRGGEWTGDSRQSRSAFRSEKAQGARSGELGIRPVRPLTGEIGRRPR